MTNKAFLLLVVFGFLISGCRTIQNYENVLNTWTGGTEDELVVAWGPPTGFFKLSTGGSVLEYLKQRNLQFGGITTSTPKTTYHRATNIHGNTYTGTSTANVKSTSPTYNVNAWCKTRFTTDSSGVILDWTWEGNDCEQ